MLDLLDEWLFPVTLELARQLAIAGIGIPFANVQMLLLSPTLVGILSVRRTIQVPDIVIITPVHEEPCTSRVVREEMSYPAVLPHWKGTSRARLKRELSPRF